MGAKDGLSQVHGFGYHPDKGNKAAEEGKESSTEVCITEEREEAGVRVAGIRDSGNILPGREQRTDTDASNAASFLRAGIKIILSLPFVLVGLAP